jgi:hypothetical protein
MIDEKKQHNFAFLEALANTCKGMVIERHYMLRYQNDKETEELVFDLRGDDGSLASLCLKMVNIAEDSNEILDYVFQISVLGNRHLNKDHERLLAWSLEPDRQAIRDFRATRFYFSKNSHYYGKQYSFIIKIEWPDGRLFEASAMEFFVGIEQGMRKSKEDPLAYIDYCWFD